jgi:hypothetical protein
MFDNAGDASRMVRLRCLGLTQAASSYSAKPPDADAAVSPISHWASELLLRIDRQLLHRILDCNPSPFSSDLVEPWRRGGVAPMRDVGSVRCFCATASGERLSCGAMTAARRTISVPDTYSPDTYSSVPQRLRGRSYKRPRSICCRLAYRSRACLSASYRAKRDRASDAYSHVDRLAN